MSQSTESSMGAIYSGLGLAQEACAAVKKDARNNDGQYRYASAEVVIAEGKTALRAGGLQVYSESQKISGPILVPLGSREVTDKGDGLRQSKTRESFAWRLTTVFVLAHKSGATLQHVREWPVIVDTGCPLDKAVARAATTSLSYYLRDLLLMPRVEEEVDASPKSSGASAPEPKSVSAPDAGPVERALGAEVGDLFDLPPAKATTPPPVPASAVKATVPAAGAVPAVVTTIAPESSPVDAGGAVKAGAEVPAPSAPEALRAVPAVMALSDPAPAPNTSESAAANPASEPGANAGRSSGETPLGSSAGAGASASPGNGEACSRETRSPATDFVTAASVRPLEERKSRAECLTAEEASEFRFCGQCEAIDEGMDPYTAHSTHPLVAQCCSCGLRKPTQSAPGFHADACFNDTPGPSCDGIGTHTVCDECAAAVFAQLKSASPEVTMPKASARGSPASSAVPPVAPPVSREPAGVAPAPPAPAVTDAKLSQAAFCERVGNDGEPLKLAPLVCGLAAGDTSGAIGSHTLKLLEGRGYPGDLLERLWREVGGEFTRGMPVRKKPLTWGQLRLLLSRLEPRRVVEPAPAGEDPVAKALDALESPGPGVSW